MLIQKKLNYDSESLSSRTYSLIFSDIVQFPPGYTYEDALKQLIAKYTNAMTDIKNCGNFFKRDSDTSGKSDN